MKNLWNIISFQIIWWSLALLTPRGLEWLALVITAILLAVHWRWISTSPWSEWKVVFSLALLGYALDFALHGLGFIQLNGQAPYWWLLFVWFGFASTWTHSLRTIIRNPWFIAIGSFIFGPLSYYGSQLLGLLTYPHHLLGSLFLHGLVWAIFMLGVRQILYHQSFFIKGVP